MWKKGWGLLYVGWMLILSIQVVRMQHKPEGEKPELPSFSQPVQVQTRPAEEHQLQDSQTIVLPYAMEGYPLTLQTLMIYEGPFREDGTESPVVGAMALILENTGQADILSVSVELRQEEKSYTFEAFCIPAGARVMVVEKEKQGYCGNPVTFCRCTHLETGTLDLQQEQIALEPWERCDVLVTNFGAQAADVTLVYKLYMQQQALYVGGIAYSMTVPALQPGETRQVRPYPFTWSGGRILAVSVQICESGVQ